MYVRVYVCVCAFIAQPQPLFDGTGTIHADTVRSYVHSCTCVQVCIECVHVFV